MIKITEHNKTLVRATYSPRPSTLESGNTTCIPYDFFPNKKSTNEC